MEQQLPVLNSDDLVKELTELLVLEDFKKIKEKIGAALCTHYGMKPYAELDFVEKELKQVYETQTIERTKYYIKRLIKALTEAKYNKVNDINLNRWKEYGDIITDSLWILGKRNTPTSNRAWYWGNFVPEIPKQLITRYTKEGEWVLDAFAGSGTTLFEAGTLKRNSIGIELQQEVADKVNTQLSEVPYSDVTTYLHCGDSSNPGDIDNALKKAKCESVQLVILHPPYWNIIKFSDHPHDLSVAESKGQFLSLFHDVVHQTTKALDSGRHLAVVIGDKYENGELIPLGFECMNEALSTGKFILKSIVVKNYETTKGKMGMEELWRYRALVGGIYVFKHEYIFILQKK